MSGCPCEPERQAAQAAFQEALRALNAITDANNELIQAKAELASDARVTEIGAVTDSAANIANLLWSGNPIGLLKESINTALTALVRTPGLAQQNITNKLNELDHRVNEFLPPFFACASKLEALWQCGISHAPKRAVFEFSLFSQPRERNSAWYYTSEKVSYKATIPHAPIADRPPPDFDQDLMDMLQQQRPALHSANPHFYMLGQDELEPQVDTEWLTGVQVYQDINVIWSDCGQTFSGGPIGIRVFVNWDPYDVCSNSLLVQVQLLRGQPLARVFTGVKEYWSPSDDEHNTISFRQVQLDDCYNEIEPHLERSGWTSPEKPAVATLSADENVWTAENTFHWEDISGVNVEVSLKVSIQQ